MKIGFTGFGNMGSAIAKGLINEGALNASDIYASGGNYEKLEKNCKALGINPCKSNREVAEKSELIVIAVKPYMVEKVIKEMGEALENKILVSVAVNTGFDEIEKYTEGIKVQHISTLPNVPMEVGKGILMCEERHSLDKSSKIKFEEIFGKIALIKYADEKSMNAASTISGCGPAFVAMFIEALADAGVKYGMAREDAYAVAAKMLEGTAALQLAKGGNPGNLKDAVCSPGGTTIKGVTALESTGFRHSVISSIDAILGK